MLTTPPIIDTNITLGQWPTRRVPCDNLQSLLSKLRAHKVNHAWASHYDALFHNELTEVNNTLAKLCAPRVPLAPPVLSPNQQKLSHVEQSPHQLAATQGATAGSPSSVHPAPQLIPFGSINPLQPNWQSELDRCQTTHHMPGIRLHPNYHNYKLDHPAFAAFLAAAAERKYIVQLTVQMEDARMMHPLMRVPTVDLTPLEKLLKQTPTVRLILLNALTTPARTDQLARLMQLGNVYTDIASVETLAALEAVLKNLPPDRILFGSHTPMFYFESAYLKLQESNLPATHLRAIAHENAQRLLQETHAM
jgi:hypothetical protein